MIFAFKFLFYFPASNKIKTKIKKKMSFILSGFVRREVTVSHDAHPNRDSDRYNFLPLLPKFDALFKND